MRKTIFQICIIEVINSLERACEEYSKLVPAINELQQAKVTMASMLDRIRQEIDRLKKIITLS